MSTSLKRLRNSEQGASAVEFALVSVPFIAFLLFTIQAVIIYFANAALETYTNDVARGLLTGATQQLGLNLTVASR